LLCGIKHSPFFGGGGFSGKWCGIAKLQAEIAALKLKLGHLDDNKSTLERPLIMESGGASEDKLHNTSHYKLHHRWIRLWIM
jgi:hypothetical protein